MACAVLVRMKIKPGRVGDAIEFMKMTNAHTLANGAKSSRIYRTSPGGPNTNMWTGVIEFDSLQDMAGWFEVTSASPTLEVMERLYDANSPIEYVHAEVLNEVDVDSM